MKILHLTVHLGGGAGKAITGILKKEDTVILLEKPEKDYYVKVAEQRVAELLIAPSEDVLTKKIKQADIVLINWWGHPLMTGFLAQFPKIACRLVIWNHVNGCVYPYLSYDFLNEFDQIMFTTEFSYSNSLWTKCQKKEIIDKSVLVYGMGGFQPKLLEPKQNYQRTEKFKVGYIGTLNYAKMNPDFLTYCEIAAKEIPEICFYLVGDLSEEVRKDIEKSSISDKFEVVGYVKDTESWYKQFDVLGYLLNDYNYATTENVLLEAMAYGIPIVVLNNDVEKHIIYDSVNGFVVNTPEEYAECLKRLYTEEEIRKQIGKQARDYVCKEYDNSDNNKRFNECMQKCITQKKKIHDFTPMLGKTPYEYFKSFLSQVEQKQLEKLCISRNNEECILPNVFMQESKGSIFHYCKYFQEDKELKNIANCLKIKKV